MKKLILVGLMLSGIYAMAGVKEDLAVINAKWKINQWDKDIHDVSVLNAVKSEHESLLSENLNSANTQDIILVKISLIKVKLALKEYEQVETAARQMLVDYPDIYNTYSGYLICFYIGQSFVFRNDIDSADNFCKEVLNSGSVTNESKIFSFYVIRHGYLVSMGGSGLVKALDMWQSYSSNHPTTNSNIINEVSCRIGIVKLQLKDLTGFDDMVNGINGLRDTEVVSKVKYMKNLIAYYKKYNFKNESLEWSLKLNELLFNAAKTYSIELHILRSFNSSLATLEQAKEFYLNILKNYPLTESSKANLEYFKSEYLKIKDL